MSLDEKLGYVMLGYEKAITSLKHLHYASDTIQILVTMIYQLQCDVNEDSDTDEQRQYFAEEHIKMMTNRSEDYSEMFLEKDVEYLMNAIRFFGNSLNKK
jgi:hypothetical protein